jgi:hypothetical protein
MSSKHYVKPSGSSLPLIFRIHVRSWLIYWGGYFIAEQILRWWYFTCKKPENIICDGILHVNMFHYFRIPCFTCTVFTKYIYNEYIGPLFFIARCSKNFASALPEAKPLYMHNLVLQTYWAHPSWTLKFARVNGILFLRKIFFSHLGPCCMILWKFIFIGQHYILRCSSHLQCG